MGGPRCWVGLVGLVRRMHASAIEGLHGEWRKSGEATVVLDWRMMVWIVSTIAVPGSMMVLERVLMVVVFVIHLQLAHAWLQTVQW